MRTRMSATRRQDACAPSLLLDGLLGAGLISSAGAPDAVQTAIALHLIHHKAAARASDADGDVVVALDADALAVIAPHEAVEIACGLDGDLHSVLLAIGI